MAGKCQENEIVELHLAFMWDCNSCGVENFCRSIVPELGEEELAELRDEHGINAWEAGKFSTAPGVVTCKSCGATFNTDHRLSESVDEV